jgi:ADP-heptose:LPS heptosyltransferase
MKVLIIRFSSIGDLTQSLSIPSFIKSYVPQAEIHFVTRRDLSQIAENHPNISKLWTLDRRAGLFGLIRLIRQLRKENFTHIYDAHNNLRSLLIRFFVNTPNKLVRPMMRFKRFLMLNFHINRFEMPFSGQRDLIKPLESWGLSFQLPPAPQLFIPQNLNLDKWKLPDQFIVLAPSAAYELKRWPLDYFDSLVKRFLHVQFVILAGPEDKFTHRLDQNPNVINLTGQTSLIESAAVLKNSLGSVCNDTGLLHFSEQLGKPTIALMGPAPFGFPSRSTTTILERDLRCRPCSKHGQGPCVNSEYQACLRGITVDEVSDQLIKILPVKI